MANHQGTGSFITGRMVTETEVIEDAVLAWEGERITSAGAADRKDRNAEPPAGPKSSSLPPGALILPGLVDLHCHGGGGGDFTSGNEDQTRAAVDFLHRRGTTTTLASTCTVPLSDLVQAFTLLSRLAEEGLIAGIHSEGPFLSPERCGAHDTSYLRLPDQDDVDRLIDAAGGHLLSMTYAPELEGSELLVYELVTHGVIPSIGHTNATAEQTAAALDLIIEELDSTGFDGFQGRPTATHLFNAMPSMHHRSPGPVPLLLERARTGELAVEIIADNVHLHPDTVRMAFIMAGPENVCLVSDSTAGAGRTSGNFRLGRTEIHIEDGAAVLSETGALAGGNGTLIDVVRCAVDAGVALVDAVRSATSVPAAVLGLSDEVGSLRPGLRADALVVSEDFEVLGVLRAGVWLAAPNAN
ncbi:N-acetylglucosamine-6-phosphate deacetylase [Arthrobacter sp. CAN_A214]|uniref:N-acetylglucosamine-6-phosphate deacetylase n=1 Tax=Arthrobacter sp. CAN_A214 TaxID=2787720 RepID=UPI0018C8FB12